MSGGPNIVALLDVVRDQQVTTPSSTVPLKFAKKSIKAGKNALVSQSVRVASDEESLDSFLNQQSKTPSLIFEYVNNTDFRSLYPKFVDYDVRYYIFELLKVKQSDPGPGEVLTKYRHLTSAIVRALCTEMSNHTMS